MLLLTRSAVIRLFRSQGGENTIPVTTCKLPAVLQEVYLEILPDPQHYSVAVSEMEQIPKTFERASQLETSDQSLLDWPLIVPTAW